MGGQIDAAPFVDYHPGLGPWYLPTLCSPLFASQPAWVRGGEESKDQTTLRWTRRTRRLSPASACSTAPRRSSCWWLARLPPRPSRCSPLARPRVLSRPSFCTATRLRSCGTPLPRDMCATRRPHPPPYLRPLRCCSCAPPLSTAMALHPHGTLHCTPLARCTAPPLRAAPARQLGPSAPSLARQASGTDEIGGIRAYRAALRLRAAVDDRVQIVEGSVTAHVAGVGVVACPCLEVTGRHSTLALGLGSG